jgi:hypothetical protein
LIKKILKYTGIVVGALALLAAGYWYFLWEEDQIEYSYKNYLENFTKTEVPIYISQAFLSDFSYSRLKVLDSSFVAHHIEANEHIIDKIYSFDNFDYFAFRKFKLRDAHTGVIYIKKGRQSSVNLHFYLAIYDFEGERKSKMLLAEISGECEELHVQEGSISKTLNIRTKEEILTFDESCDKLISSESKPAIDYRIDKLGFVRKQSYEVEYKRNQF